MKEIIEMKKLILNYLQENKINLFSCPCCWFPTLYKRNVYDICCICWWEDDGQDEHNKHDVLGWPNWTLSLYQAQKIIFSKINYKKILISFQEWYNIENLINKIEVLNQVEEEGNLEKITILESEINSMLN